MRKFVEIFKDDNQWNEKTIIGFLSFAVMVLVMLADVITDLPDWHVAVPPTTAIVTFRHEPENLQDVITRGGTGVDVALKKRDRLQLRIAEAVKREGRFWISAAPVPGGHALRLNVISWLTSETLVDEFLTELPRYAREAMAGLT